MKEVSYRFREAFINLLSPLVVDGITIPIFDERVPPESVGLLPVFRKAESYIIVRDQFENESTNDKCQIRQDAIITLDVITKFPKNGGGKIASELISEAIQLLVNRDSIIIPDFDVLNVRKESSNTIIENTNVSTLYRKLIRYRLDVYEQTT
jgi:hypothetical protein